MAATASSSNTGRGAIVTAIGVLAVAAYCVALHLLIADGARPRVALALALAPWGLALLSMGMKGKSKRRAKFEPKFEPYWLAAGVAVAIGLVVWRYGDVLAARVERVVYFENLAFDLFLALVFAITLRPGHEALVTRLARIVRGGHMPEAIVPYTRAVTAAWAIWFVAIAAASTLLYFTQSRETWSLFINVLIWPLTAAMFVVEYLVRLRVLRDFEHVSLLAGMRAFKHRASGMDERR